MTRDSDFASIALGCLRSLMEARNKRGEGGDHDTTFGLPENGVERAINDTFRRCPARLIGVGAISHQKEDAAPGKLSQFRVVRFLAIYRRIIELIIATVDDKTEGRVDAETDAIRD